ncbi:hypothetical protein VTJ83DRAFT_2058 [Remersonia thermophila]|uniref:DNA mismatch repair proteins mutS family domain-containing protein n=1 Tax=Remersonia thermophila TaxID=72144 RepID=A0ABR4DHV5_9PEZI
MPARGSAPSVYSTVSHLLSPCGTDSSASSAQVPREGGSSLRPTTPVPHSTLSTLSYSPFSGYSDDVLSSFGNRSHNGPAHQTAIPGSRRSGHDRILSGYSGPGAPGSERRPNGYKTSAIVSTPLSNSLASSRLHTSSTSASEPRGLISSPLPCRDYPYSRELPLRSSQTAHREPDKCVRPLRGAGSEHFTEDPDGISFNRDSLDEIIMAVDMQRDGKVGCAYYTAMDESLVLEEDISMGGIEAIDTILVRIQPTSIIVPNRAPIELVEFLERDAHQSDDNDSSVGGQGAYILHHIASARFDYEAGREMLASLDIGQVLPDPVTIRDPNNESAQSIGSSRHCRLMRLAETINLDSILSVGCAGALLNDLERRRLAEDPSPEDESDGCFRVKSVQMNTENKTLLLSADALLSLQIVQSELHPNPQTRASNRSEPTAKETLSITGLLQALASSTQGKRALRRMLLRPTTDINLIEERHRGIEVLLRSENRDVANSMRKLLRKLKNANTLLRHVRKGVDRIRGNLSVRVEDWKAVLRFSMASTQLHHAVQQLKGCENIAVFMRIRAEINVERFLHIGDTIMRTIDFQISRDSGITEILSGASEYLDGLRHEFAEVCRFLPELARHVAQDVPEELASYIRHCTVMADLGFLVAVQRNPTTGKGVYHGQYHVGDVWELVLATEEDAYYKNQAMRDLDSQYGDLLGRIADEEIEVMMALAAAVLQHEDAVMHAAELFGELDSLLALALAAEKYTWTAPTMTTSNTIDIVEGRHPLQELLVPSFIPNDCVMAGGGGRDDESDVANIPDRKSPAPSILILTGPNNSGKSIYMRQVALIVYLAHTGSYVPAVRATIGITDRILTRIATRETVVSDESAFLVDVKQAAFAMNFATRRSLLLIDEFGKGTTAETGSALFTSYLAYFRGLGTNRPKVLAGTHFHEVFEQGLIAPGKEVAFAHMDARLDPGAEDPEDRVTFLYRLLPGRGKASLGILCAAVNDIPTSVIERAKEIATLLERNESLVDVCSGPSAEDEAELRQAELIARRFLALQVPEPGSREEGSICELLRAVLALDDEEPKRS